MEPMGRDYLNTVSEEHPALVAPLPREDRSQVGKQRPEPEGFRDFDLGFRVLAVPGEGSLGLGRRVRA